MTLFSPALHELARIYDRQINRASLWLARRKLAKAETDLGLLGWQQADFAGEAQRHVQQLTNVEQEQARQTNESAALGLAIREGKEKREAGRKKYEEERAALEATWTAVAEPVQEMEQKLAASKKVDVDFDRLMANLDRELAEVEELKRRVMLAPKQTPELHAELIGLRERAVAIPNAKTDLQVRRLQASNDIRQMEGALAEARPALDKATRDLRVLDEQFARSDGTLERQITQRTQMKAEIERKINDLEKSKNNPYREIGQVLADHDIAPLNQPQALDDVKHRRAVVVGLARAISRSFEATAAVNAGVLRRSWFTWAGILFALLVVAVVFLRQ